MENSKKIAKLIGPTIVVLTVSEMMNYHIWATNIPPNTYLNGILLFVGGLLIVQAHNYWGRSWPILITLIGWGILFIGILRVFFPEAQQLTTEAPHPNFSPYLVMIVLCVVGIFLIYKSYFREQK